MLLPEVNTCGWPFRRLAQEDTDIFFSSGGVLDNRKLWHIVSFAIVNKIPRSLLSEYGNKMNWFSDIHIEYYFWSTYSAIRYDTYKCRLVWGYNVIKKQYQYCTGYLKSFRNIY